MFTGIITDLGRLRSLVPGGVTRLVVETGYDVATVAAGASIACNGVCLSVVDKGPGWFAVDVSGETLACTTIGGWAAVQPINLERPLKLGDELGGNLVAGHVDGLGEAITRRPEGDNLRLGIPTPQGLVRFIALNGSID